MNAVFAGGNKEYEEPSTRCMSAFVGPCVRGDDAWFNGEGKPTVSTEDQECKICKQVVLRGAVQCRNCSNLFCASCRVKSYGSGLATSSACPLCRVETGCEFATDTGLGKLRAHCPKCVWVGKASDIVDHLESGECTYEVGCRFKGSVDCHGNKSICSSDVPYHKRAEHAKKCKGAKYEAMAFRKCGVCGCLRRDLTSIIPSRQVLFQGGNTPVVPMDHRDRKKTRMCGACALEHLQGPYFRFKYQRKEQGEQGVNSQEREWTHTHPFQNKMWRFVDAERRFMYDMQKRCGLFSIPSKQDARLGAKYVNDTHFDRLEDWCSGVGLTNLWTISENPTLNEFCGKEFWFPVARLPITAKHFDGRIAAVERVSFEEGSRKEARQPFVPGIWHGSGPLKEEGRDLKFSFDPVTKDDLARNVGDAAREAYPKKRRIATRNITVVSAKGVEVGDEGETVHPKMDVTVQVFVHESGEMFNLTVKYGEVENLESEFRHGLMRFCLVARPPTSQAKGTFHQVPKKTVAQVFSSSNCIGVSSWGISEKYASDFNKEHKPPEGPFYHPFPHLNDFVNGTAVKRGVTANPRFKRSAAQRESVKCDILDECFREKTLQDGILVAPYAVEDSTTRSVRIPIPPGFQASFLQLVNGGVMTMKKSRDEEGGEKYEFEWNEGREDPSLVLHIFLGACDDLRAKTFLKDSPTGAPWVNPFPLERVGRWAGGEDRMKVLTEDEKKAFDNREEGICKRAEDILSRPAPDSETANYYDHNAWQTSIYKETWTAGMDPSWKEVLDKLKNPVKRAKLDITV